jgi:hypothetical protein
MARAARSGSKTSPAHRSWGRIPHAAKRAIAHGDGWIPIGGRALDPLEVLRNSDKWQRMPAAIPLAHLQRLWGAPRPGGSETLP